MADLNDVQAAGSTKLVGSDATGLEQTPVKSTVNGNLNVADVLDNGGLDAIIDLNGTPKEGKVGATVKADRKYVIMEALANGVKWGFTNTSQSFDLFKSQLIMVPCGPNTSIWFKMSTGTGQVAFAEVS